MKENTPYRLDDNFYGNKELFKTVFQNPETIVVYDIDGILADTPKIVLKNFSNKHGINVNPEEIDNWTYLSDVSIRNNLDKDSIKHAEDDWYAKGPLYEAPRYLYIKPVVQKTISLYGQENNFVLTSRNPSLAEMTHKWFEREKLGILESNILMRKSGGIVNHAETAEYKVGQLKELSKIAPWVVFIDDSVAFIKAVVDSDIKNCLMVNIPLGIIRPNFSHERLIVINRYPVRIQAMYPLMDAINRATNNY